MKVDFHCHTKKTKKGEPETRNVTPETFKKKIEAAEIDIVAITNHNAFFEEQYEEFNELGDFQVWPGVELDTKSQEVGEIFHVVLIADPDRTPQFSARLRTILGGADPDIFCADLDGLVSAFADLDVMFVPHYAGKSKSINEKDKEYLTKRIPRERLFMEPKDLRSLGICAFHGENMVIGSDVHDWSSYEQCNFAELRLDVSSFGQLLLLSKRDNEVVRSLLSNQRFETMQVSPAEGDGFDLTLYHEVNVIFGEKGTGKSKILESIGETVSAAGKSWDIYKGSDRDKEFSTLLSTSDMAQSAAQLDAADCSADFEAITNWSEPKVTLIDDYLDWQESEKIKAGRNKMKIVQMKSVSSPAENELKKISQDYSAFVKTREDLSGVDLDRYLQKDDADKFCELLDQLIHRAYDQRINAYIQKTAAKLTNKTISIFKDLVAAKKGFKSVPATTGFESYARSRISLLSNFNNLFKELIRPPYKTKQYIGELEGKGRLFIESIWRFPCEDSSADEYPRTFTKVKELRTALTKAKRSCLTSSFTTHYANLVKTLDEHDVKNLDFFVGTKRHLVFENGAEYVPSSGEQGILLLGKILNEDHDVYLIDEPELGIGNSFVEDFVRPKVLSLGKQRKIVVVVTHNANLAVRTLPYTSIYREHVEGEQYRTYVGNAFIDILTDINDASNFKSWTELSLRTLEGGREAFGEREIIYGTARD